MDRLLQRRRDGGGVEGEAGDRDDIEMFMDDDGLLPLKSVEDVHEFEGKLEDSEYKMKMVNCFYFSLT